eukprot:TRINITY_DN160_c0_g1_i6.p1 TRINITY_DN160_c0_g1~~TRINITY_DN160_c0_g1_i6.p1  ORF type:complete len:390 (+),score=175.35 TRINITY_DN160_c0_g1_i6:70-1170(+)
MKLATLLVLVVMAGTCDGFLWGKGKSSWGKSKSKSKSHGGIWGKSKSPGGIWDKYGKAIFGGRGGSPPTTGPLTPCGEGIVVEAIKEYKPVVESIVQVIEEEQEPFRPLLVRMAWHSMAQYNPALKPIGGGAGGCLRPGGPEHNLGENKGLDVAADKLEKVKKAHPFVSYADLYQLAGNTALEYMGSPELYFKPGRRDFVAPSELESKCITENERMPIKHFGEDRFPHRSTLQYFFDKFEQIGISLDKDENALHKMVSLMGAHNFGAMHKDISGNEGQWTTNNYEFGNEYYYNLENGAWGKWTGQSRGTDLQYKGGPGLKFIMLPIDMVMREDNRLRNIVRDFSRNKESFSKHFAEAWKQIQMNGM